LIVPCNSCGRALSFEEEGQRAEAVTCPECGARVRFPSGPAPWEDAEPDPVPVDPDWFVLVQSKQVGPLDAQALVERVRSGEVHGRTFVWRDGFDGWRRALEVPELIPLLEEAGFGSTPPHGPFTPAEGISAPGAATPPGRTPSGSRTPPSGRTPPGGRPPARAATLSELAPLPRRASPAPAQPPPEEELELARVRRSARPPPRERDDIPSGLTRKSPWKLALVLCAALALPVGGLAWLVSLRKEPLVAPHGDAPLDAAAAATPTTAAPVRRVQELRDMLLGKKVPPPAPPPPAGPSRHVTAETKATPKPADGAKTKELRALYGDGNKADVGPRVRRPEAASSGRGGGGPSSEEVSRVVGQTQGAFQSCIEQQLRKNPSFRGGKVSLVATVGSSGTVKQVQLDRRDLEGTDLGDCLKARARRMVFASFSGDDVDVEIPLVLTTTL
jgi:GYF domain 2